MSRRPIQAKVHTHGADAISGSALPPELLREGLSYWACGVTVVAASDGEETDTITISAFTPVSLDPPLVLVCIHEQASILPMLLETRRFTINLLPEDARRTASMVAGRISVAELPFATSGDPVLAGALASFVCRLWREYAGGDHRIVLGEVERVELGAGAKPLLYFRREYRAIRSDTT